MSFIRIVAPLFGLAMLAVLLAGCSGLKDKESSLDRTLNAYGSAVRWGDLASTYDFLAPELAGQSEPPGDLGNIRVIQYEVLQRPVTDGDRATLQARISYVHRDRQVVRTLDDRQEWRHDSEAGWRRSNPIPRMPP